MCDAFAGVMGAISVASSVASMVGQQTQANAQYQQAKAAAAADEYNANLAIMEMHDAANKENIQQSQEHISLANEKMQRKKETMRQASAFTASSMAEGQALSDVNNEYSRAFGEQSSLIDTQLKMLDLGHEAARKSYSEQAKQRINGMSDIYITPIGLSTGLNIASGVLGAGSGIMGAVNEYKTRTAPRSSETNITSPGKFSLGKTDIWDTSRWHRLLKY